VIQVGRPAPVVESIWIVALGYQLEILKMKEMDKWLKLFQKMWEERFNLLDKVLDAIKNKKK
jgi:hypothetical protein